MYDNRLPRLEEVDVVHKFSKIIMRRREEDLKI